jgi:hypothetical protein
MILIIVNGYEAIFQEYTANFMPSSDQNCKPFGRTPLLETGTPQN